MNLRLNYIAPISLANGPGRRYTIWVQGCSIRCNGCHNVDTWDPAGGFDKSVDDLIKDIQAIEGLDGVTITGGEPLDQIEPVYELCSKMFKKLSIFLTTGYTLEQLYYRRMMKIVRVLDILCSGPFIKAMICDGQWKGSANQDITAFTELGEDQLLMPVVPKEIIIDKAGAVLTTGFHP
jgi:anaerobic ribonucleoside-triphosphate reductase activating protein